VEHQPVQGRDTHWGATAPLSPHGPKQDQIVSVISPHQYHGSKYHRSVAYLDSELSRRNSTHNNRQVWGAVLAYSSCIHRRIDKTRLASFLLFENYSTGKLTQSSRVFPKRCLPCYIPMINPSTLSNGIKPPSSRNRRSVRCSSFVRWPPSLPPAEIP